MDRQDERNQEMHRRTSGWQVVQAITSLGRLIVEVARWVMDDGSRS
ncbi:hypothetical protein [Acrocarpospora macrocephala]|nr:hypothetical protein [Acrocarpospora macrocephala]